GLARRLLAKRAGKERRRRRGAGDQEGPRGILVEPVNEARTLVEVEAQRVEEAIDVSPSLGATLHREPGRLIDDDRRRISIEHEAAQQLLVLRSDAPRRRWRCRTRRGLGKRRQPDRLTRLPRIA